MPRTQHDQRCYAKRHELDKLVDSSCIWHDSEDIEKQEAAPPANLHVD